MGTERDDAGMAHGMKHVPEPGERVFSDPSALLRAQASLIAEQMKEILTLKQEQKRNNEETSEYQRRAMKAEKRLVTEETQFLRSINAVLGMLPGIKGNEAGEFVAACARADRAELRIAEALKIYDLFPKSVGDTSHAMAKILKEQE